jgi:hypothetical protein
MDVQVGDLVEWRGLSGHLGVVVVTRNILGQAWVAYLDNPSDLKEARVEDLVHTSGEIDEQEQRRIDEINRMWASTRQAAGF